MAVAHGQRVLQAGEPLTAARAAMVLLHGRGATAEDIMTLAAEVERPGWAYLAPQASGNAWYPNPFTAPLESNEPYLSAALDMVSKLVERVEAHVPAQRIILLGFSQGACLTLEWAARNARRYGAVVGLSGGLIGPDGTPRDYPGTFDATPLFLGCSDVDPHIAMHRVVEAGEVLKRMGADVALRFYPGMAHTVSVEELDQVLALVESI
ncbi:MAG: alpha/beta fold hydrolase [Chloroflexi bacterium]|nr:MAG: alpha/beta fold hydrolase [Chloroflexota bacterium]TMF82274.1 MAG: alpha/beta fold hydrolase [Chloroflexota bacterium]